MKTVLNECDRRILKYLYARGGRTEAELRAFCGLNAEELQKSTERLLGWFVLERSVAPSPINPAYGHYLWLTSLGEAYAEDLQAGLMKEGA